MSTNGTGRPATISELAEQARNHNDERSSIKSYLRLADQLRRDGKQYAEKSDLQKAFVAYARAASIVLERIPNHREYQDVLKATQRSNLALNGQEMLDNLGQLKPILIDRYEKWASQPQAVDTAQPGVSRRAESNNVAQVTSDMQRMQVNGSRGDRDLERIQEERDAWIKQREDVARRLEEDRSLVAASALSSARIAAGVSQPSQQQSWEDYKQRPEVVSRRHESPYGRQPEPYKATTSSGVQVSNANLAAMSAPALSRTLSRTSTQMYRGQPPLTMPLESPTKYEGDSTDSEAMSSSRDAWDNQKRRQRDNGTPTRYSQRRSPTYPPPTTTTSPYPSDQVSYPELMSQHQMTQGYVPSLNSMFITGGPSLDPSSLLFNAPPGADPRQPHQQLYSNILPQPASRPHYQSNPTPSHSTVQYPLPQPQVESRHSAPPTRIEPQSSESHRNTLSPDLKTVYVPRECLPKFLAIAKVNTAMNRETCGLLLGKPKGQKYIVTTLLIPKQHSTSDTCTMDEEELVLLFTEERNLITLGWIHTHPSQSCFMSSVDLHTHSAFQCMLPESFAVVCAPKSNPNFGIFRLTDPPGLQTVLQCTAKEAFHPHPDVPIYTDADKGHVQMKDLVLEIVDIR